MAHCYLTISCSKPCSQLAWMLLSIHLLECLLSASLCCTVPIDRVAWLLPECCCTVPIDRVAIHLLYLLKMSCTLLCSKTEAKHIVICFCHLADLPSSHFVKCTHPRCYCLSVHNVHFQSQSGLRSKVPAPCLVYFKSYFRVSIVHVGLL
jgi:hypothetical protein